MASEWVWENLGGEDFRRGIKEARVFGTVDKVRVISDFPDIGKGNRDISEPIIYFVFIVSGMPI